MKDIHTRNIEDQRSKVILDNSPDAVVIFDVDTGKFVDFNENAIKLLKIPREVLLTLSPWDITPDSQNKKYNKKTAEEHINFALLGGNPIFDWVHMDSEGNEIPCEIRLIQLPYINRNVVMASMADQREKLRFEKEHRENLERLKLTLESTGLAWFDWSSEDGVVHWDENIFKVLGLDEKTVEPGIESFLEVVHPEDVSRIRLKLAGFLDNSNKENHFEDEFRIIKNNDIHFIYGYGSLFRNKIDDHVRVLGTLQDRTQKKQAESQLEYQAKLLENVSDAVYSTDLNFRISSWNKAATAMYGWAEEEAIGKAFNDLIPVNFLNKSKEDYYSELMDNGAWKGIVKHKAKNGNEFYIQASINLIYDSDGNPCGSIGINRNINEQRKTERKLLDSEKRLKMALQATRLGIWDWFPQQDRIIWNERMHEIFGTPRDPKMNLNEYYLSILHPDDVHDMSKRMEAVFAPGNVTRNINDEYRIIVDGVIKHIYSYGYITRDENQVIQRITGAIQDVTPQKTQKEKLAYHAQILSNVSDVVISTDKDFRILSWNKAAEKLYGYSESEVIGKVFYELVDLRYIDQKREDVIKEFELKGEVRYIQIHKNRKGEDLYVISNVNELKDENNKSIGLIGVVRDISEKIEAEEKLKQSEEKFRMSFNLQFQYVGILSPKGEVIDINELFVTMTGVSKEEFIGKLFWDTPAWANYPELQKKIKWNIEEVTRTKGRLRTEEEFMTIDGESRYVIASYTCVENDDGSIRFILAEATDITDRKIFEEELKQTQLELSEITKNFQDATKAANVGIWEWNTDEDIVNWNATVSEIYGIPEEVTSCSFDEWKSAVHYDDIKKLESKIKQTLENSTDLNCEFRILRPDKTIRYVKALANINPNSNLKVLSGVTWDMTQEKETEIQKRKARKLETRNKELEQFAYVASHDLQEPLHTMVAFTELLQEGNLVGDNEDAKRYLGYINDSAKRMSRLVKGLLDYSRIGRNKELSDVDCNLLVDSVTDDLNALIKRTNASVVKNKLPVIKAAHTEVQLLFQNLLSNAIKFHKPGVDPLVEVSCRRIDSYWQFSVKDNGIGIEEEYREKIFIIFQRLNTRNEYEGTGIGLAHCQKIVEMLGGKLWLESSVGEGSIFYFTVPV